MLHAADADYVALLMLFEPVWVDDRTRVVACG